MISRGSSGCRVENRLQKSKGKPGGPVGREWWLGPEGSSGGRKKRLDFGYVLKSRDNRIYWQVG